MSGRIGLVIILDTNQLFHNMTLDTPTLGVLKAIATQKGHRLGIPALVANEFLAVYERKVASTAESLAKQIKNLQAVDPSWAGSAMIFPDPQASASDHAARLLSIFEILPVSDHAAAESLRREVLRQLPACEKGGKGIGARDVAIWLTVIDQLRSEETVYFVASDIAAYGKEQLHSTLKEEADALRRDGLRYCPSILELLNDLADRREIPQATERLIAADVQVKESVKAALKGTSGPLVSYSPNEDGRFLSFQATGDDGLEPETVSETHAYSVGSTAWAAIRITWIATQPLDLGDDPPTHMFTSRVPTTILAEIDSDYIVVGTQVSAIGRAEMTSVQKIGDSG
jgi:predicted nucleic acid-binding protein